MSLIFKITCLLNVDKVKGNFYSFSASKLLYTMLAIIPMLGIALFSNMHGHKFNLIFFLALLYFVIAYNFNKLYVVHNDGSFVSNEVEKNMCFKQHKLISRMSTKDWLFIGLIILLNILILNK